MSFDKSNLWIVYKHTSPSGKIYIGITSKTVSERAGRHGKLYDKCPAFWKAIQKYGWENFSHEILAENLSEEEANELEKKYIELFKANDPMVGYNICSGGKGKAGYELSSETRAKMSKAQMGNKKGLGHRHSEEWKQNMRQKMQGRIIQPESIEKIRQSKIGKPPVRTFEQLQAHKERMKGNKYGCGWNPSDEQRRRMSESHKGLLAGEKNPMYGMRGAKHPKSKPVIQFAMNGDFIEEYPSATVAAQKLWNDETKGTKITAVCKGRSGTTGGYLWAYKDGSSPPIDITKIRNKYKVEQYDLVTGKTLATYDSPSQAEKMTGIKHIGAVCRHEPHHYSAGGYGWRYICLFNEKLSPLSNSRP